MRFTRFEIMVSLAVKIRPALLRTACHCCDDTLWFEMMYKVFGNEDRTYNICTNCATDKYKAYELVNPQRVTVQDIIIRNAERSVEAAMHKVEVAQEGLKRIIQAVHEPSADWNPERDKVIVGVTVEAENTLRELDRGPVAVQPPIRRKTKKRDTVPAENKEQVNVQ